MLFKPCFAHEVMRAGAQMGRGCTGFQKSRVVLKNQELFSPESGAGLCSALPAAGSSHPAPEWAVQPLGSLLGCALSLPWTQSPSGASQALRRNCCLVRCPLLAWSKAGGWHKVLGEGVVEDAGQSEQQQGSPQGGSAVPRGCRIQGLGSGDLLVGLHCPGTVLGHLQMRSPNRPSMRSHLDSWHSQSASSKSS